MPSPPLEMLKGAEKSRPIQYRELKTAMQVSLFFSRTRATRKFVASCSICRLNENTTDGIRPAPPAWQPSRVQRIFHDHEPQPCFGAGTHRKCCRIGRYRPFPNLLARHRGTHCEESRRKIRRGRAYGSFHTLAPLALSCPGIAETGWFYSAFQHLCHCRPHGSREPSGYHQ